MIKFNQDYCYIHHLFTFYCLCLYWFHGQYLPTADHFPIYTEYYFPFPSININATEWWEGSISWGKDSRGFKRIEDKWKNRGRARCCLWMKDSSCMPGDKNNKKELLIRDRALAFSQACCTVALYVVNSSVIWYVQHFWKQPTHPIALHYHSKESLPVSLFRVLQSKKEMLQKHTYHGNLRLQ